MIHLPLHTERLLLRDFAADDVDAVHAYVSDPDVTRYMFYDPRTLEETHTYLDLLMAGQRETPRLIWDLAVVEIATGRLVGACDLTRETGDEADLGFIFSRDVWDQGYATEAARAMVRAAFEQLHVSRVFSTCDTENRASARVLEKAGLLRVATLEKHKFARDRWWTSFLYELTRESWASGRKTVT